MHDPNGKEWTFNWPCETNVQRDAGSAQARAARKQLSVLRVSSQPPLYAAKTFASVEQHYSMFPVLVHELPREVTHLRMWQAAVQGFRASANRRQFLETTPWVRYFCETAFTKRHFNHHGRRITGTPASNEVRLPGPLPRAVHDGRGYPLARRTPSELLHRQFRRLIQTSGHFPNTIGANLIQGRTRDDPSVIRRLHLAHLGRCSTRRRLTLAEVCEWMVLHPHEPLWVPDSLDVPVWSLGVDWGREVNSMHQQGVVSNSWFTQEVLGGFVNTPADVLGREASFKEEGIFGERDTAIERIVLLTSKDVCGSCPLSLLCVRGKPLYVASANRDFHVRRCYRCHCVAFSVSQHSKKLKPDNVVYVCPHLRHGVWSRASKGLVEQRQPTAHEYVSFVFQGLIREGTMSIPGGCHENCDYDAKLGYNPDHSLNKLRKTQRQ